MWKIEEVIHVKEKGMTIGVDEITMGFDTPDMIRTIKSRYQESTIRIYPDASGG